MKIASRDSEKCPCYRFVRLTSVRLMDVMLYGNDLRSAGTSNSLRLVGVSVLWDVRLKRFHCITIIEI